MATQAPEHLNLLPSILSPQTSYPLVDINRSNGQHRLPDWTTLLSLRRKFHLPIYNTNNTPTCKCGKQYDCWGDHTFHCKLIRKKLHTTSYKIHGHRLCNPLFQQRDTLAPCPSWILRKKTSTLLKSLHSLSIYLLIQTLRPQIISTLPAHTQQLGQTSPLHTAHPQPLHLTSWEMLFLHSQPLLTSIFRSFSKESTCAVISETIKLTLLMETLS
jgi:hypothetical protein